MKNRRYLYLLINWLPLILIIIIAAFLRFDSINFDLPFTYHPDEPYTVTVVRKMILLSDFNPHKFHWGSLLFYIQIPMFLLAYFIAFLKDGIRIFAEVPNSYLLLSGRILIATLGVLSVFFIYRTGLLLNGKLTAITSAILLAVSPLHIGHSHLLTPDVPMVFFLIISLYFVAKFITATNNRLINYCLAGLFLGISISTKYLSVFFVLALIAFYLYKAKNLNLINKNFILMLLLVLIGFIAGSPYILIDYKTAMNPDVGIFYNLNVYTQIGVPGTLGNNNYICYFNAIKNDMLGIIGFILIVTSIFYSIKNRNFPLIIITGFAIIYFTILSIVKSYVERNILLILPFISIIVGYGLGTLINNLSKIKLKFSSYISFKIMISIILLTILVITPLKNSFAINRQYSLPDVRNRATWWVMNNIPKKSKVAYQAYAPYLPNEIVKIDEGLIPNTNKDLNFYMENDVDFLIFSSGAFSRYISSPDLYPKESKYFTDLFNDLNEKQLLLKTFTRSSIEKGPDLLIYWIPSSEFFEEKIPLIMEKSTLKLKDSEIVLKLDENFKSDLAFLGFGWEDSANEGTWMIGDTSTIFFYVNSMPDKKNLEIWYEVVHSNIDEHKKTITVLINDKNPKPLELNYDSNSTKKIDYQTNEISPGLNKLTINIDIAAGGVKISDDIAIQEKKKSILFKKIKLIFK